MTNISQRLSEIKQIYELALEGRSDEEIAQLIGMTPSNVTITRRLVGISRVRGLDITKETKLASTQNGQLYLTFTIKREHLSDLGINPERVIAGDIYGFSGKIKDNKLIMTFAPR